MEKGNNKDIKKIATFGERLKAIREEKGLSQTALAKILGCTSATVSSCEKGTNLPSLELAKSIAESCNVSLDYLCGLSESKRTLGKAGDYAEAIEQLAYVGEIMHFNIYVDNGGYVIRPTSEVVQDFLPEWADMLKICNNGSLGKKVYHLWLKEKLQEYKGYDMDSPSEVDRFIDDRKRAKEKADE